MRSSQPRPRPERGAQADLSHLSAERRHRYRRHVHEIRIRDMLLLLTMAFAAFASSGAARMRAVRHPSNVITPASVMWIGAHPDDEALVAPLLGKWCRGEKVRCAFLILTRGESGV